MKTICLNKLTLFATILIASTITFGQSAKLSPNDFAPLSGKKWTGTLTYKDYGTGKPVTILSEVIVSKIKDEKRKWNFSFDYPEEPKANRSEVVELSIDGLTFDGEHVIEQQKMSGGVLKFVTETDGEDDNKPALIRHIYTISKSKFTLTKLVRFGTDTNFIERNSYKWKR